MTKKGEKILTQNRVIELGLDEVSVITADMIDGYTSIGNYAFYCCSRLISITIPDSVTSIEIGAFEGCCSLTSVIIPNSVTCIGYYAFFDCSGLTSVTIPDSVTNIGDGAFRCCSGLTSITITNSVTSIGEGVFDYCNCLTSVTIPNSVTNIGNHAFYNCRGLVSVTIPNSVTSIGYYAFFGCSSLTSVSIGDKEYKTQEVKDGKCKAYKAFMANMTCRDFQYKEGETYELDDVPILCEQGFHACLNLADVFTYYAGKIGKDIVIHEVELEGVSDERNDDSKVVAKKITIGKRIL